MKALFSGQHPVIISEKGAKRWPHENFRLGKHSIRESRLKLCPDLIHTWTETVKTEHLNWHQIGSCWGIENQMHWVSDMVFHEDVSRIREDYVPENLASSGTSRSICCVKTVQQKETSRPNDSKQDRIMTISHEFSLLEYANFLEGIPLC
jgi:hypothetical protein